MADRDYSNVRSDRRSQRVTLNDVARAAGVSVITVSRVLNKPELVSEKTRKRVKAVVQEMGYVPNLLAGNLKSNRSRLIVVLMPTISGSPFLKSIQVFTDYVTDAGYQVMIGQTGYDNSQQESLLDVIIGRQPDGIVVTGRVSSKEARRKLLLAGIPVVETWQIENEPVEMMVGFSHIKVGEAIADYLWRRQRRHFAVVVGHDERGQQRLAGFSSRLRQLQEKSKPSISSLVAFHVKVPSTVASGKAVLSKILKKEPRIDAIVCCSDALAVGVLYEAQIRKIEIPKRLAVIGYGDTEIAAHTIPTLSTVKIDGEAIGRKAAKMLIARAEGCTVDEPVVDIGFTIMERQTT